MLPTPRLSVVVAVYNGAATLSRCLESVVRQTYLNRELIVIDGGSQDGTVELLKAASDRLTHWVSEKDRGIYHAWNKGLARATGDWTMFLGADDHLWNENVLSDIVGFCRDAEAGGVRLVYGLVASLGKDGGIRRLLGQPWEGARSLTRHEMPPHPGMLHHRSLFHQHGTFDERYRVAGDYELLLRELVGHRALFARDVIVCGVAYGGKSVALKHLFTLMREDMKARQTHGIAALNRHYAVYYARLLKNAIAY